MLLTAALGLALTQSQVDFVIPDIDQDRRLCIDPFLLFKSRDAHLRALHDRLVTVFNTAFQEFRKGDRVGMDRLIDFPEVNNIGLGYSAHRIQGSGMGSHLNRLVAETLTCSPALLDRGIRHVEELQLVSLGIGADRISDMAANILKAELVNYTREQCQLWSIPVERAVPLHHLFDLDTFTWYDDYVDLPTNPRTGMPLLFVPRRIVRILPWINFEDYERSEFKWFLQSARGRDWSRFPGAVSKTGSTNKATAIEVTRREVSLLDAYVNRKESQAGQVEPQLEPYRSPEDQRESEELLAKLRAIAPGNRGANEYQREMLSILNYLFGPELVDGKLEERTIDGTERRDIIFTNESDRSFWQYTRQQYGDFLVMFEAKNVTAVDSQHINQVATYLGDRLGRLGVVLTRNAPAEEQVRKTISVFNNEHPRKVILILHDDDIEAMIKMKANGENPTKYMQQAYRAFKVKLQ